MPNLARLTLAAALLAVNGHAAAIIGGTSTTAFEVVGGFSTGASGVQITDSWVLTARHVGAGIGALFTNGYGSATVAQRYPLSGPGFPQNDLALLRLGTPIDIAELPIESTVLPPGALATPIDATMVTGANQVPRGYGQTRVQAVLAEVDPDDSGPLPVVPVNWLLAHSAGFGPPYVQGNDSGGALFLGHVTDRSTLLGVTSALFTDEGNPAAHASGCVQLSAYRDWIDATMAADPFDEQAAMWVSSVPEPTCTLLWVGALAIRSACAAGVVRRLRGLRLSRPRTATGRQQALARLNPAPA